MSEGPILEPNGVYTPAQIAAVLDVDPKTLATLPIRRAKIGHRTVRYRGKWVLDFIERRAA